MAASQPANVRDGLRPYIDASLVLGALVGTLALPLTLFRLGLLPLAVFTALLLVNTRRSPAGAFCWPNLFLVLLVLFHLGYYVPVAHGLVSPLDFMPDTEVSPDVNLALKLVAVSMVAFEAGVMVVGLAIGSLSSGDITGRDEGLYQMLGIVISGGSLVLLGIYVGQLGGLSALGNLNYSEHVDFLQSNDPRFAAASVIYLPAGLSLVYAFSRHALYRRVAVAGLILFILWLLWLGDRGAALLYLAALAYVRHVRFQRLPVGRIALAGLVILCVIGPIREVRNLDPSERASALSLNAVNPLRGLSEMGQTFRPYLVFVQLREQGTSLGTEPYRAAVSRVAPNLGLSTRSGPGSSGYYRSTVLITEEVDPISARLGIGVGGSAVGEPYAAFGVGGLLFIFFALGALVGGLELRAVAYGSSSALAFIVLTFHPIDWYIRDDAYGLVRPLLWAALAVATVKLGSYAAARRLAGDTHTA